ncbi:aldo/keto reductase [bacterium]|nr:aldo/keto reductase [bacterium]
MRTRKLGDSGIELTEIGFGAWAIGGGNWEFTWGEQDDAASIAAIHKALDSGINWIDTAAVYGLGHSETIVGRAVRERGDNPFVATKCALQWDENRKVRGGMKYDSVKRECEASLSRLGFERIDLYQIHWPDPDEDIEEGWRAVCDLVKEGKVRFGGVSNFNVAQMSRVARIGKIASLQPPYSMLAPGVQDEILPYCGENGMGVVAYSPLACGVLTESFSREKVESLDPTDWRRTKNVNYGERLEQNLTMVDELRALARETGVTVQAIAVAWVLRRPEVTSAIVGFRSPEQVSETLAHLPEDVGEEVVRRAEEIRNNYR